MSLTPDEQEAIDFLDFQEESRTPDLPRIGEDVAGYRLLQEIGSGGGGVVFEALQLEIDRKVAIKMIPLGEQDLDSAGQERIRREARLLAALEHPGIIEIFDSGVVQGYRWVAMQHVAGPSLRAVLHGEAPDFPLRGQDGWTAFLAQLLHQVAQALSEAHANGVLHLDVKPSNILLESPGRAFLVDFGIARTAQGSAAEEAHGFRGTPKYAAPEQLLGQAPTAASDVYAFGCMAFEALNGEVPFPHAATDRGRRDVQVKLPVWTHARGIAKDFVAIVNRCLEKDPADRYPDANALAEDLDRFLRFEPVLASNRSLPSRLWLRMRLRPKQTLMASSILALALATVWLGDRLIEGESQIVEMQVATDLQTAHDLFHRSSWSELDRHLASLDLEDKAYASVLPVKADLHLARREFEEAHAIYTRVLDGNPSDADTQFSHDYLEGALFGDPSLFHWAEGPPTGLRGLVLAMIVSEQRHEPERTLAFADQALELHPTSHFVLDRQSFACSLTGRHSAAIEILKDCLALNPSGSEQLLRMVQNLNHMSQFTEALRTAEDAIKRDIVSTGIHAGLASTALSLGRIEEAQRSAVQAREHIASVDDEYQVLLLEAALMRATGKGKQAQALLEDALKRDPDHPMLLASLARNYLGRHVFDRAEELTERLAQVEEYRWQLKAMMLRVRLHAANEELEEAWELLERPEVRRFGNRFRVSLLQDQGRTDLAIETCYQAIEEEPGDLALRFNQIRLLRDAQRYEEAHDQALLAFSIDPHGPEPSYWLASVLMNRGDVHSALKHAQAANKVRPDWPRALTLEGECLILLDRDEEGEALKAKADALRSRRNRNR